MNYKIMLKEFAISGSEHNPAFRDKKFFQVLKTVLLGNKPLVSKVINDCEDVLVADTLEELVEKMNALQGTNDVQLAAVREAVENYDRSITQGPPYTDKQQQRIHHARKWRGDKARTSNMAKIGDPKKGPFVAIREFILSRKSLGGIQTDLECRVLTEKDAQGQQAPIPGLYAIGEAAGFGGGGMHGHRSLEGTFLGGCVITARVAAAAILGRKLE
ncbi:MAG: FAD-binding protein [Bacteroidota bacterium]